MNHIPEQRKIRICDLIRERGLVSIKELALSLGASEPTIRRDLDELKRRGSITRIHGGAIIERSLRTTFEPAYDYASKMSYTEKLAIGEYAASRIEDGQSVIFDSSSTVCEAARFAAEKGKKITAITNDVNTARVLAQSSSVKVIMLGGTIRVGSYTALGEPGISFLERLHVDVTILGIHAICDGKLSDTCVEVAAMKNRMIQAGREIMILADSTKFAIAAFCDVCILSETTEIITDWGITETHQADLRQGQIPLVIVEPNANSQIREPGAPAIRRHEKGHETKTRLQKV